MTAPSTDELIARLRQAANGSGGAGGPRCLQTAAADRLETLRKAAEGMAEALGAVRDYAFDVSTGALTYRGGGDLSEMATEDLARIDAALAAYEELKS